MPKAFKRGKGFAKKDWDSVCDNPELTDEQMSKAKPFAEALPKLAATIRRGPGQQSRIDQDLRPISKIK